MNINNLNSKTAKIALEFCIKTFGVKSGLDIPKIIIHRIPNKNMGEYDSTTNIIHIYKNSHKSFLEVMDTIIHEYTHYLQNMRAYDIFAKTGTPYKDNPYELEAFRMGSMFKKHCKKYVSGTLKFNRMK